MLGFFRKRHEIEKRQIMGRLAAVETLGMLNRSVEQTTAADRTAALQKLRRLMGAAMPDNTLNDYLQVLIAHLRKSEVNINFRANQFFAKMPADKYATKFEVLRTTGAPFGGMRNETEEKMFHYTSVTAGARTDAGTTSAVTRINELGPNNVPGFAGIIRPRYCTLNFSSLKDGFGAQWGRSHLKLADRLKLNMSFVHTDSFDVNSGRATNDTVQAQIATYHNMTRLVRYMSDVMLDMLVDSASGVWAAGQTHQAAKDKYRFGDTLYIEGHSHGEILFSRDVAEIRICDTEMAGDAKAEKNLAAFAGKHKLNVVRFT